jgi:hypothetical protein
LTRRRVSWTFLGLLGACGGTGSTAITTFDGGGNQGTLPADGGAQPSLDAGFDAGISVTEEPAPTCHDVTQKGSVVTPTMGAEPIPAPTPATTIPAGVYVLVSETDYGALGAVPEKITVVVTSTRYYYLYEFAAPGKPPQRITLDWRIENGVLKRRVLCASTGTIVGTEVDDRIDATSDGYTLYVQSSPGGPTSALRYARVP